MFQSTACCSTTNLRATSVLQADTLSISGHRTSSLSAVLAEFSYMPIAPLVAAFGGTTTWNAAASIVVVDFSSDPAGVFPPAASIGEKAPQLSAYVPLAADESGTVLAAPRFSVHENYTRVAVDLPEGLPFQLAVSGNDLIALFPGARRALPVHRGRRTPRPTRLRHRRQRAGANCAHTLSAA